MKKFACLLPLFTTLLIGLLPAAPAQAAGVLRTFLSAAGSDSNNCANVATPCRHLATAFAATAPDGEIYILDPANYGSLTITHGVSIQGHGWGSISPQAAGVAITVDAGSNDVVNLDGLTIDGGGVGQTGIQFNTGKSLTIENCVIRHMTTDGIDFFPSATSSITVSNTVASNNGDTGIYVYPSGDSERRGMINRVEANNNGYHGIFFNGDNTNGGRLKATVSDSVAAGNGYVGIYVNSNATNAAILLTVVRSVAANNGTGIYVNGDFGVIQLANSTVTGNETNYSQNGSSKLYSYGDNNIDIYGVSVGALSQDPKQ